MVGLLVGLALMVMGSLVKGLTPCFSLVAGLRITLSFNRPGMVKMPGPFLPRSLAIKSLSPLKTLAMSFLLKPVLVASSV